MIKFIYEPKDLKFYNPVELSIDLPDDSNITEIFDAFKKFAYAMSFGYVEGYDFIEKEEMDSLYKLIGELNKDNEELMEKLNKLTQPKVFMDNPRAEEEELDDYDDDIDDYDDDIDDYDDDIEVSENDSEHKAYEEDENIEEEDVPEPNEALKNLMKKHSVPKPNELEMDYSNPSGPIIKERTGDK